ncbi:hypothetical protein [Rivularia sp. UHCC 0363]|uniref:hypothetical protein n=1 Tax=Rivularia sp. UHCC 0363 TaxID=3110244 RepID=UPI002B1F6C1E|nr:hypothetical protein [Rivularia sp. UHCC 0363]MEA5595622.1 hypothetical protein [Rivularia sp. UHCC 0363]
MEKNTDDLPIADWISEGQRQNAIHLIVVYDGQNGNYKPVYVQANENIEQKRRGYYTVVTDLRC